MEGRVILTPGLPGALAAAFSVTTSAGWTSARGGVDYSKRRTEVIWRFSDESLMERQGGLILIQKEAELHVNWANSITLAGRLLTSDRWQEDFHSGRAADTVWHRPRWCRQCSADFLIHFSWQRYNKMQRDCVCHRLVSLDQGKKHKGTHSLQAHLDLLSQFVNQSGLTPSLHFDNCIVWNSMENWKLNIVFYVWAALRASCA